MECVTGVPRMSQHPCGKPSAEPRSAKGESDWNAYDHRERGARGAERADQRVRHRAWICRVYEPAEHDQAAEQGGTVDGHGRECADTHAGPTSDPGARHVATNLTRQKVGR